MTALSQWKLDEFYDFKSPFVVRNAVPTIWEKLKPKMKKAGKWGRWRYKSHSAHRYVECARLPEYAVFGGRHR